MKRTMTVFGLLFILALTFIIGCQEGIVFDPGYGQVTIALKDAPADELALFEVDVTQIILTKISGGSVTVLPAKQRVNFAELTDISQILIGSSLPAGTYVSAVMTLDFTDAAIQIEGVDAPAQLLDGDGAPLTGLLDVPLAFKGAGKPYVSEARPALFVFDLDLNSSLDIDTGANTVAFDPVISCTVNPSDPNPIIIHGRLLAPESDNTVIEVGLWNYFEGEYLGSYKITTDAQTVFHVNGAVFEGQDGVNAVNALQPGMPVWAHGTMNAGRTMLKADFVVGGWGVVAGEDDCVHGTIIARTGGSGSDALLTVRGRGYDRDTNLWTYHRTWTVDVSYADTRVVKWRSREDSLNTDHFNVGQHVRIYGNLDSLNLDATDPGVGLGRLLKTDILGYAAGPVSGGQLTVDLVKIGYRPIGVFDFNIDGDIVVDPVACLVDTGLLNPPGVDTDTPVRLRGFMAPVGAFSVDPDFKAVSVMSNEKAVSLMVVRYVPADIAALASVTDSELIIDTGAAAFALVDEGLMGAVPLAASPLPSIVPAGAAGIYTIIDKNEAVLNGYTSFDEYSQALADHLAAGAGVVRIAALGQYDADLQQVSAIAATVWIK